MRKLQFDREQSNTNHPKIHNHTSQNRSNSLGPRKEYKLSVIATDDSINRFILRHSEKKEGNDERETETQVEQDYSQNTKSLGKSALVMKEKKEEAQATLKTSPQQEDLSHSNNKSLIIRKEFSQNLKRKIEQNKDPKELSREMRQFNQTYVIDRKLIQTQKELTICETKVYFPYQPYKVQLQYMQNVLKALQTSTNAVLQSPTGTGKTLCLLASVLSFVEKQFRGEKVKHNVIYMSRTHSQLKQVQKQLAKTCYRPNMAIFASRQQLCLKENLSSLRGKEKIEACGRGVKLAKKFKRQMTKIEDQDPKLVQSLCEFYKEREEVVSIGRRKLANTLLDIDIMKQIGREQIFCPYFYPIMTRDFSNLFIMPYNYLLDQSMLKTYQELLQNSIIIFDQAHNVSQAACEGRGLMLQTHHLDSALLELNKILSKYLSPSLQGVRGRHEKEIKFMVQMIQDFKESFGHFISEMFAARQDRDPFNRDSLGREEPDVKVINKEKTDKAIFQLFCGKVPDQKNKQFDKRQDYYKSAMMNRLMLPIDEFGSYGVPLIEDLKETPDGVFSNFERVLAFCMKIKQLLTPKVMKPSDKTWEQDELSHYRFYVNRTNSLNGPSSFLIGLRCLVPFLTFKDILRLKPRSILLTSGTLKPLQMWQKELRVKFPMQLSNKHVISPEQIAARVIKNGPAKTRFTFTYDNLSKNRVEIYKDFIDFLVESAQRIPNGILLVFPSFKIQTDFKYELMRSPKRGHLSAAKQVIFEEKSMDINMNDFKKKALSPKGAILCIICRGKVSEGIDFPDGMCRAVFIVGVPYPNIKDPFIIQKKSHLQNLALRSQNKSQSLSGEEWYLMGTVRAINQAIGRVIRHASDYGMVFLVDTRYCDHKMQKELPGWITQSMGAVDLLQSHFYDEIQDFYQRMAKKYRPRQEKQEQYEESRGGNKVETNALKILMGNRKKMKINRKPINNNAFDF